MKKGICLSVALAAVGLLITSCFVPETFTATVRITKDYQYAVEYNGTVGFGPALEEIAKKGKLSPQDNAMFMASTEELFPKKDGFQSASYKGDGRWKVEWKQEGTLTNTVHCFGPDVPVASLARLRNGAIQFNGMRINEADIASLKQVKFTVNGTV